MNRTTFTLLMTLAIGVFFLVFYLARDQSEPVPTRALVKTSMVEKHESVAEQTVMATLWQQQSGEAKALYYQAYQLAALRLNEAIKTKTQKPKAIIVDIDETVLDNSPHQAKLIERDTTHPAYWEEWCRLAKARPTPGALEFLDEAKQKGVEVFYISNRSQSLFAATLQNLQLWKFPFADSAHLLLRADYPSKEARRQKVAQNYEVILLCGDNLADFSEAFEHKSADERNREVERLKDRFGKRFIVLPNPMYGDWETASIGKIDSQDAESHARKRKAQLTSF
ncbi:MAG: 5'-nucleotidase, lipoprotein e(P4) family [Chloroherpetonaceae bacterium]